MIRADKLLAIGLLVFGAVVLRAEITLVDTNSDIWESNQSTTEVAPPAGMQDDDVLVLGFCKDDNPSVTCTSDGLTLIDSGSWSGGTQCNGSLWYRVITDAGSEPSTYTCTHDEEQGTYITALLRGVDTGTPLDVANSEYRGNNDITPAHPGVTTVTDCAWIFMVECTGDTGSSPVDHPSGSTERLDLDNTSGNGAENAMADFVQVDFGATGDQEWTGLDTGAETVLHLQAFRPATADCTGPAGRTRRMF